MKRFFSFLLALVLVLCAVPTAAAAGSAGWNGPSVVRAGDTIALTFFAGGGVYGGSGTVTYDSSLLTLQGYTQLVGGNWAVEWGGNNFLFYDNSLSAPLGNGTPVFKATFTVNTSVPVGTKLSVSATSVVLSNGQTETEIGTVSYNATVAQPLSGNCDLAALTVSGASVTPAFSPATTRYRASVPFSVASIGVTATAAHDGAKVSVYNPQLTPGGTTYVQVTVTAENGKQKIYTIEVARGQDPNYVPSSNALLKDLTAEGGTLSPAFGPEVTQYYIWLPYEAEEIRLTATADDSKATCTVGSGTQLPAGQPTDIPVTVTAEDGTQKVYTVTVVRAPAHDRTEDYLAGRMPEPEPTEPAQTEPEVTEPTAPTEPVEEVRRPDIWSMLLPAAVGFAAGAGLMLLILLLLRKKKP